MVKLRAAAAKFKTKALNAGAKNKTTRSPKLSKPSKPFGDWLAKTIVGSKIKDAKLDEQPRIVSAFESGNDASLAERLKLREQRMKALFKSASPTAISSSWGPLPQSLLKVSTALNLRCARMRLHRRRRKPPQRVSRTLPDRTQIASIGHLQSLLGLDGSRPYRDVTFVSIDCEFSEAGGTQYVTEIGITTLKASHVMGTAPGLFVRDWTSKLKHHHMIVNYGKTARWKENSPIFAKSVHVNGRQAKAAVQELLRSITTSDYDGYFALVGHSVWGDIEAMMNCPDLEFDIRSIGGPGLKLLGVFDTYSLGMDAKMQGAELPGLSLGMMANSIGIDPVYRKDDKGTVVGWHNASNDAAYTMMCLLLFATDWNILIRAEARSATMLADMRRAEDAHAAKRKEFAKNTKGINEEPPRLTGMRRFRRKIHQAAVENATASLQSRSAESLSWWSWLKGLFSKQTTFADEVAAREAELLSAWDRRKQQVKLRRAEGRAVRHARTRAKIEAEPRHEDMKSDERTLRVDTQPLTSIDHPVSSDARTSAKGVPQVQAAHGIEDTELDETTLRIALPPLASIDHLISSPENTKANEVTQVEAKHESENIKADEPALHIETRPPISSERKKLSPRRARKRRQIDAKHKSEHVELDKGTVPKEVSQVEAKHDSENHELADVELDGGSVAKEAGRVQAKREPGDIKQNKEVTLCRGTTCQGTLCKGPIPIDTPPMPKADKRQRIHNRAVNEMLASVWWKHVPKFGPRHVQIAFAKEVAALEARMIASRLKKTKHNRSKGGVFPPTIAARLDELNEIWMEQWKEPDEVGFAHDEPSDL